MLFEVAALAAAIDAEEVGFGFERGQHAVPGVHREVDALARTGDENERVCPKCRTSSGATMTRNGRLESG